MLVIVAVLLILIIVDGIRRMISKNQSEVKLSKHAKKGFSEGVAMDAKEAADAARLRFELPGETRVKKRAGDESDDNDDDGSQESAMLEDIPVLDQPVEQQLNFDDLIKMSAPEVTDEPKEEQQAAEQKTEDENRSLGDTDSTNVAAVLKDDVIEEHRQEAIDEVVAIHVRAQQASGFDGSLVLSTILELGLRYGSMEIFHKRGKAESGKRIVYSLANAVEPGTFNLKNMASFSTPCVVFFMQLPGPERPIAAFREMLDAADKFAKALGGELLDEQRNVLHQQTLVHIHERLQEYERKQLLAQKRDKQ